MTNYYPLTAAQKMHHNWIMDYGTQQVSGVSVVASVQAELDFGLLKKCIQMETERSGCTRVRFTKPDKDGNVTRPGYWQINEVTTTYYITEETPPKGHENNYSRQSISVTMPRDADQTFRVTFTDTPKYNKASVFDIEKLGVKGEPIKGVVFKVEYFDGDDDNANLTRTWHIRTDESGHAKLDNQHLDTTQSSDPFYMYEGNIVIPIGGYLKITEEAAPAEYVLDEEPVGVNTVEGGEYKFTYANNNAWYNELQRCRVDLQKYEADGTTPIAGVEVEIKFLEAAIQPTSKKHPNFKRLLDVGDTLIRHTDGEGNVFFDNLDQGEYEITEIKTKPAEVQAFCYYQTSHRTLPCTAQRNPVW